MTFPLPLPAPSHRRFPLKLLALLVRRGRIQRGGRLWPARIGIALAVFFLVLGLGTAQGIARWVRPALESLFPERRLVARAGTLDVALLRVQTTPVTQMRLEAIRALPGVAAVHPQMPVRFPLHARGKLGPVGEEMVTEVAVHGVERALVAGDLPAGEPFDWTFESPNPCPVILSRYFLDLYNLGIAESNRLPRLNESAVMGRTFELVLGWSTLVPPPDSEVRQRVVRCRVAGLTRDPQLAGLALPLSAVREFNHWFYGEPHEPNYTVLQIDVNSPAAIEPVTQAVQAMGLAVRAPGEAARRWRWAMRGGFVLAASLGIAVLLLAMSTLASTVALVLAERRAEMGLYRALGARKSLIRLHWMAEIAWLTLTAALGGAALAALAGWGLTRVLQPLTSSLASLPPLSLVPGVGIWAGALGATLLLSLGVTWPGLARALRLTPAELLRD